MSEPGKSSLKRALESLRRKFAITKEYTVISEDEKTLPSTRRAVQETRIYRSEYSNAMKLKDELIQQFEGKKLKETIPGNIISNQYGNCYSITSECPAILKKASYEKGRGVILSDFKLLLGIGSVYERRLKEQGYKTILDLTKHPRWDNSAKELLEMVDNKNVDPLWGWFNRRLPKSHPLVHYLASFYREEDFAIIDIETLGLAS